MAKAAGSHIWRGPVGDLYSRAFWDNLLDWSFIVFHLPGLPTGTGHNLSQTIAGNQNLSEDSGYALTTYSDTRIPKEGLSPC